MKAFKQLRKLLVEGKYSDEQKHLLIETAEHNGLIDRGERYRLEREIIENKADRPVYVGGVEGEEAV